LGKILSVREQLQRVLELQAFYTLGLNPEMQERALIGYRVLGFWHDKEDDVQADVLADELDEFRYETGFNFDEFKAWPLFHMTDELVQQKNRAA
jgi:hypothetical protein